MEKINRSTGVSDTNYKITMIYIVKKTEDHIESIFLNQMEIWKWKLQ